MIGVISSIAALGPKTNRGEMAFAQSITETLSSVQVNTMGLMPGIHAQDIATSQLSKISSGEFGRNSAAESMENVLQPVKTCTLFSGRLKYLQAALSSVSSSFCVGLFYRRLTEQVLYLITDVVNVGTSLKLIPTGPPSLPYIGLPALLFFTTLYSSRYLDLIELSYRVKEKYFTNIPGFFLERYYRISSSVVRTAKYEFAVLAHKKSLKDIAKAAEETIKRLANAAESAGTTPVIGSRGSTVVSGERAAMSNKTELLDTPVIQTIMSQEEVNCLTKPKRSPPDTNCIALFFARALHSQ
jgi:hypothetical protein